MCQNEENRQLMAKYKRLKAEKQDSYEAIMRKVNQAQEQKDKGALFRIHVVSCANNASW